MAEVLDSGGPHPSRSIHRITLLRPWEGYSIRVTDPRTDYATPCGPDLGPELNEAFPNQRRANQTGGSSYFPVVLVKPGMPTSNKSVWSDTRRRMDFPYDMRVALIPMLPNLAECKHAKESLLVEDCLRLNTEAKAMIGGAQ